MSDVHILFFRSLRFDFSVYSRVSIGWDFHGMGVFCLFTVGWLFQLAFFGFMTLA